MTRTRIASVVSLVVAGTLHHALLVFSPGLSVLLPAAAALGAQIVLPARLAPRARRAWGSLGLRFAWCLAAPLLARLLPSAPVLAVALLANLLLALAFAGALARHDASPRHRAALAAASLAGGLPFALSLACLLDLPRFRGEVVRAEQSRHQTIVIRAHEAGFALFLDGALQLDSTDERIYHEALVGPALRLCRAPRRVLILGGGDGLAARDVLAHPGVERLTLVDIDARVTRLARSFPPLSALNAHALDDPRVTLVHADALAWMSRAAGPFDIVLADFPDPSTPSLARLFSPALYASARRLLAPGGLLAAQATSRRHSPEVVDGIVASLESSGFSTEEYQRELPSFGDAAFVLASASPG